MLVGGLGLLACVPVGRPPSARVDPTAHAEPPAESSQHRDSDPQPDGARIEGEAESLALELTPVAGAAGITGECDPDTVAQSGGSAPMAERACAIDLALEQELGAPVPDEESIRLHAEARRRHLAGDSAGARALYEHAMTRDAALPHPGHISALVHNDLGLLDYDSGSATSAQARFDEALAAAATPTARAVARHNLALAQRELGSIEDARSNAARAHAELAAELGPDHPGTATARHTLAIMQIEAGEYAAGLEGLEQAATAREASLGPMHPTLAATYTDLAIAYGEQGQWPLALELHERALDIDRSVLGPRHATTAVDLVHVGAALVELDRVAEARLHFEAARAVLADQRPAGDPELERVDAWIDSLDE
jgi:tetratricopeptide (TPR) repeat protein